MKKNISKFNVVKFNGKGDFGLWKYKMICQLELLGLDSCIQEEPSTSTSDPDDPTYTWKVSEVKIEQDQAKLKQDKLDKDKVANNLIFMSLEDLVLQKVMKETTTLAY